MENIKKAIREALLERIKKGSMGMHNIDDNWRVCVSKGNKYDCLLINGNSVVKKISYDINDISEYVELWDDLIEEVAEDFHKYIEENKR